MIKGTKRAKEQKVQMHEKSEKYEKNEKTERTKRAEDKDLAHQFNEKISSIELVRSRTTQL